MSFRTWAETHDGAVRSHNEDALLSRPEIGLWAVADGAGGHDSGEVASNAIMQALALIGPGLPPDRLLAEVRVQVNRVHLDLQAEAARRGGYSMIASTLVVLIVHASHFACLWAGDSRVYLMRGGLLQQVTRDHSLVQEMVEAGIITPAQAENHPQSNIITRAVGGQEEALDLDKVSGQTVPGDMFLLCSDGLCKTIDDAAIAALLAAESDAAGPAVRLIAAALDAQSRDNVTALVVQVGTDPGAVEDGADDTINRHRARLFDDVPKDIAPEPSLPGGADGDA